jgi:hypothetical protein
MIGSILAAPFRLVFWLARVILSLVGRFLTIIIGLTLIVIGVLLTMTVIGAIIGIPLLLLGIALVLRGMLP